MKSLAERHADRAQRKADNAAFSNQGDYGGNVGLAHMRVVEAQAAVAALSNEERDNLQRVLAEEGDGFSNTDDTHLYDGAGSLAMAGIGVVNPLVVPPAAQTSEAPGGGIGESGWGDSFTPNVDPAQGNQNGAALDAQTGATAGSEGAQGTEGEPQGTKPAGRAKGAAAAS